MRDGGTTKGLIDIPCVNSRVVSEKIAALPGFMHYKSAANFVSALPQIPGVNNAFGYMKQLFQRYEISFSRNVITVFYVGLMCTLILVVCQRPT